MIVFDLDGTLVDTAPDLIGSLNVLLAAEGLAPASVADAGLLFGGGGRVMVSRGFAAAGKPLDDAQLEARYEALVAHYRDHIADLSRPFPGVRDTLEALRAAGARLAVCTNKRGDLSAALLEAVGLAGNFAAIVGPDLACAAKPDPRHLLWAIEAAGGRADRAVMVGDSVSDAQAARAAAVPLVLVDFGYSDVPARDLAPDALISRFDQLPEVCAQLLGAALSAQGAGAIRPSPV